MPRAFKRENTVCLIITLTDQVKVLKMVLRKLLINFVLQFLSYYYIVKKPVGNSGNDCQPVLLDDTIMESNHAETHFPKVVPLMTFKEKLHSRKVKAVLRYHQPSLTKHIEQYVDHLLFPFYPFQDEEQLKSPPFTGSYVMKLQEPGVMDIIDRIKSVIEPFSETVEEALANLTAHLTNPDAFSQ